ncbi:MAG TPA: PKD domain-containing protein [Baekduia sp.]|uniref:PKD domain-containing protein n=1 Tax=Baekduia sp. TaxID=2600305 RepID=UPI002D76BC8C|nr:PKD domain-containing protein [Baekduia sp.]HET6506121.1 PKD domain-containing protein [Baekduia sp.]
MLDLLRPARRAESMLLAAVATILCLSALWVASSPAGAATGETAAFGVSAFPATGAHDFVNPGPTAFDTKGTATTADDDLFVADLDIDDNFTHLWPRIRMYGKDGTLKGSVSTPVGDAPQAYVVSLAVDPALRRVYALVDADTHGDQVAQKILVYSADCAAAEPCTLTAPADLSSGVLFDFTGDAAHHVDFAGGIAVDPTSHDVVVLGVDDGTAADPQGILQHIAPDGTAATRVSGFGVGLEPDGAGVGNPSGLAIGPDGQVYVSTAVFHGTFPHTCPCSSESVYRMPKETGTSSLVLTDTSSPLALPGADSFDTTTRYGSGSPIALSSDGTTLYLMEGDDSSVRVRGFSPTTGALKNVYGGGTTTCKITANGNGAGGIAAGAGDDLAFAAMDPAGELVDGPLIHLFGDGGSGCPRASGSFKVDGKTTGITVTKGQSVQLDASGSDLNGGTASKVSWDYGDGDGFVDLAQPSLVSTHRFLKPGTVDVGVRIEVDGAPPTDPVYLSVTVNAPKPVASFSVSDRAPAAGGSVAFDATDSLDSAGPDGNPTHALKEYRWDFGDGQSQVTTTAKVSHAFANAGATALARTVKLTVVSQDGVSSANVAQQTITVAGTPSGGGPTPDPGPTPGPGTTPDPGKTPGPGTTTPAAPPTPTLGSPVVDAKGSLALKLTCPAGGAATAGRIDLTTKVKKKVKGRTRTETVKVGSGAFSVDAGKSKTIKIKLSSAGFRLLKQKRRLSVTAAIAVTGGAKTSRTLALKAPAQRK